MGEIKWCPMCGKNVRTIKPFNLLSIVFFPLLVIYVLWYLGCKRPQCQLCGEEDLHPWKTEIEEVWTKQKGKPVLEKSRARNEKGG